MGNSRNTFGLVGVKLTSRISDEAYEYLGRNIYPKNTVKFFSDCDGYGFIGSVFFLVDEYGDSDDELVMLSQHLFSEHSKEFRSFIKQFPTEMKKYFGFEKPMIISVWS